MSKWAEMFRNVLILTLLTGALMFSWLLGHILRYSIPALWHPPLRETYPQVRYGAEFDKIPQSAPALETLEVKSIPEEQVDPLRNCGTLTYFTSYPAKCLTADGRLLQVGDIKSNLVYLPPSK